MLRCRSCLIPSTRPDTAFHDGQCSACVNFGKRHLIDWGMRYESLLKILEGSRMTVDGFNCIVPSSGGKDSTYQVLKLIELGAKPLVVTATTCMLTPIGRKNIDNLARYATTIEVTPNRAVRAKLNRFGLTQVGDISYPEHMAIFSIPFQVAQRYGIPLIFYGESPQREYGCPEGEEDNFILDQRWVHEFGGLLGMRASDCVGYDGITASDMLMYRIPEEVSAKAYFLGQFIPWDSHRNAREAVAAGMIQELPSQANWWPAENLDNAMTGIHDHQMWRKFGYGRLAAQLSVDIRNGLISRIEALDIVRERDGLFPWLYAGIGLPKVLQQIGLSEEQFFKALDDFTDWSLFIKVKDHRPILKEFAEAQAA